jgi:hypothetical protein
MQVTFDPKADGNQGVNYAGIPTAMVGKPSRDTETKKWDEIILGPDAVDDGQFRSHRAIRVTSLGQATPCTLGEFVRQTTNGNYIVKVTLDGLPSEVKAIRKALADAQKLEWKANGPKARQAAPKAPPVVPTVPGKPVAPKVNTSAIAPAETDTAAILAEFAKVKAELALATAALAQRQAPKAPSVPTVPPKTK